MRQLPKVLLGALLALSASVVAAWAESSWTTVGDLPTAQLGATLTALQDGGALEAGGEPNLRVVPPPREPSLATAFVFDPNSERWKRVADMPEGHSDGASVLLPNGEVMVIGGFADDLGTATASVAIFNPQSATWRDAAPMRYARAELTATVLIDGRVLVTGGVVKETPAQPGSTFSATLTATTEVFDPRSNSWARGANMPAPRAGQVATLLADGRVLVVGGSDGNNQVSSASEYDPAHDKWIKLPPLSKPIGNASIVTLADGRPLVVGSYGHLPTIADVGAQPVQMGVIVEILDEAHGMWHVAQSPPTQTLSSTNGFLLPDGGVIFFGWQIDLGQIRGLIYDPTSDRWNVTLAFPIPAIYAAVAVRLSNGDLLLVMGNRAALYGSSKPAVARQSGPQPSLLESSNTAFALTVVALLLALLLGVQRLYARLGDRGAARPLARRN